MNNPTPAKCCPICGDTAAWPMAFDPPAQADLENTAASPNYAWWLCRRCGNGYPGAPPDRNVLERIWAKARIDEDAAQSAELWQQRRQMAKAYAMRSLQTVAPLVPKPGRFLDIACGLGETVRLFAERGWNAEGNDADPTMEKFHREIGITSRIGQIETFDIVGEYQLIHIAHAIYFITDPMTFLRNMRTHLAKDGVLCVVLSDLRSSMTRSRPGYSHTFYPNAASMQYALARAGLQTVLCQYSSGSIYLAARRAENAPLPRVNTRLAHWAEQTQALRYNLIGRPAGVARRVAKTLLGR